MEMQTHRITADLVDMIRGCLKLAQWKISGDKLCFVAES